MSSKVHMAFVARTLTIMRLVANRINSVGKPCGDSNSAQTTAPMLLRIPSISTCIPTLGRLLGARHSKNRNEQDAENADLKKPVPGKRGNNISRWRIFTTKKEGSSD